MKKFILVTSLLCAAIISQACDICGCSVSNYNPFLFQYLSRNYVNVSYIHRMYHTQVGTELAGRQIYNSLLLTGQYSITKKIQLVAMIPYQQNKLENTGDTRNLSGLGDITLLGNYKLWDRMSNANRQTVLIGGGVKLPTGQYTPAKNGEIDDQNFQLGTGSVDYLLNGSYRLAVGKWSVGVAASYKYNTQNKDHYRYGDVVSSGVTTAYNINLSKITIVPYLQLMNEWQMKDAHEHVLVEQSGGYATYTGGGLDFNSKKIAFGFNYQFAPSQNLAQGQIDVKPRATAHISFTF
jgi:hypothetical protein